MQSRRWMMVAAMGLASLVALSGCKPKKTTTGLGPDGGLLNGGRTNGITDIDMPGGRPPGGALEMAGQYIPVYFEYDSAQVQSAERSKIEAVGDYLKHNSAGGVIIEGHCDERGSREYNLALGERRAMAVRAYLVSLGADGVRIQTKSFGKEKPVALGHDEESWSKNRRGEFVIFK